MVCACTPHSNTIAINTAALAYVFQVIDNEQQVLCAE